MRLAPPRDATATGVAGERIDRTDREVWTMDLRTALVEECRSLRNLATVSETLARNVPQPDLADMKRWHEGRAAGLSLAARRIATLMLAACDRCEEEADSE